LTRLKIPSSVRRIGGCAFWGCSGLTQLAIPSSFEHLGRGVFTGVTKLEHLTLLGCDLSPLVIASLRGCLTAAAKVVGSALVGREFDRFPIVAA
jgi:hypothetical protein